MLRDLQADVLAALLDTGPAPTMEASIKPGALGSAWRVEIYRHNVMTNLAGALADLYPVTQRIVGEAFFRHAAEVFCRATPSRSGDLNDFGAEWPAFIGTWPHAAELPYLVDTGRLEWAMHRAFHAAEAGPLDLRRLAAVPAADQAGLRFVLHPAVTLLSSPYPLAAIWRVNQPDFAGDQ
ncbi:MAG: putative DNA-binding domain-containing protein, partial [Betaproteobacteria bacterium]|nr:putative DNA-binding domain-containing protein [Betaproteobacteria bacterium]